MPTAQSHMYEISRDLFRLLRPGLRPDRHDPNRPARTLLAICEDTVCSVAYLPTAHFRHVKRLFARVRPLYQPSQLPRLFATVDVAVAAVHERVRERSGEQHGGFLRCAGITRHDTPCMRTPIPGERFCPTHRQRATIPTASSKSARVSDAARR